MHATKRTAKKHSWLKFEHQKPVVHNIFCTFAIFYTIYTKTCIFFYRLSDVSVFFLHQYGKKLTRDDELEPLNTPINGHGPAKRDFSAEFDGRMVHSRSGDIIGKNSAV